MAVRLPARRAGPEVVTLGVRDGCQPSPRPAVRLFLGTEPAQHRAERVFVWSLEKVRDPARVYEIHLMSRLEGFSDRRWTTGFTNYRFAVPHFAGGCGRAIYNDVDQIYLADPGELFDLDLEGHGFRAISPLDTSVMLLDCAHMAEVWTLEGARRGRKAALLRRAADRFGPLDGRWNARDGEYRRGRSALVHYTTLHTQPWRPFPERFVYLPNENGTLWHDLEREADRAGFQVFSRARPSTEGRPLVAGVGRPPLEDLPDEDLPWALDERFAETGERLEVTLPASPGRDTGWWCERFEAASARRPAVHWQLRIEGPRPDLHQMRVGGRRSGPEPPRTWVLTDDRPGNSSQSLGLADALGWPCERKRLRPGRLSILNNRVLGASLRGIDRSRSDALEPPWPDLVIAAGRRTAPAALWIRRQSRGRTRLVQLGRKGGDAADLFDLSVVPAYANLFPHPRRIEVRAPLHRLDEATLAEAGARCRERLDRAKAPRIALLVGGSSGQYRLDASIARRLGESVMAMAREAGGSVFAITSRRTGAAQTRALVAALEGADGIHAWSPEEPDENPALALFARADAFVVTADSESMLAEATSLGRPVYIAPLPERAIFRAMRVLRDAVSARARALPHGRRDTPRPQRGLEYLCARAIDRGLVRPTRDLGALHADLFQNGVVRYLGEAYAPCACKPKRDREAVVARVRALMGFPSADALRAEAREPEGR